MPDYSKTVIYKIQHEDNEELVYVGSTTDFTKRKCRHKSNCINDKTKHYKLYQMINDNGGWNCFKMIQIKEHQCNNKREAELAEDKVIVELKANMNSQRANRSIKQYYQDNKEQISRQNKKYNEDNKEKLSRQKKQYYQENKENKKEYYEKNKERILQKDKKYYENNKEKITDYQKQYREVNKEQLLKQKKQYYENKKQKVTCECGCVVIQLYLEEHKRTKKHIKLLNETKEQ